MKEENIDERTESGGSCDEGGKDDGKLHGQNVLTEWNMM